MNERSKMMLNKYETESSKVFIGNLMDFEINNQNQSCEADNFTQNGQ